MVNIMRVNANHGDDYMTKLRFHKDYIQKLHTQASMLQWILGRFDFLQNETSKKVELRRDL